jgi:hypothetical protein
MGRIYSSAVTVAIWLGPSDSELDDPCDAANLVAQLNKPVQISVSERLIVFFLRDYWSRTWIIQELILARHLTSYVGSKTVDEDAFYALCSRTMKYWKSAMSLNTTSVQCTPRDYLLLPACALLER